MGATSALPFAHPGSPAGRQACLALPKLAPGHLSLSSWLSRLARRLPAPRQMDAMVNGLNLAGAVVLACMGGPDSWMPTSACGAPCMPCFVVAL